MNTNQLVVRRFATLLGIIACSGAEAFTFETENISGSFDSTVTAGFGVRTKNSSCGLIMKDTSGLSPSGRSQPAGTGSSGCTEYLSGLGDQGNLNYKKGDFFTTYFKGSHELLLKLPESVKFMARMSWLRDFSSTHTTGATSVGNPVGVKSLTEDAAEDLRFKARLLDLWASKEFNVGDQRWRVRAGNQVISWGESLFIPGGINQVNAMDYMRLSQPGTQLKEVFLPAPIVSLAGGLGHGINFEAYVQTSWNDSYFPPTGSYWSAGNGLGRGDSAYGLPARKSKDSKDEGQYGAALRWQPDGTQLNLGVYAMAYHDKTPNFSYNAKGLGTAGWVFAEDRRMYGVSANFPVGDWAIGTEVSYRPKDLVSLNQGGGCVGNNGNCYAEEKKIQWHLTGMLSLTPSDYGGILNMLGGAQTATLMVEAVAIRYPGLKRYYNGDPIGAGAFGWGLEKSSTGNLEAVGNKSSWAYNFNFSWVYDGTVIPGWQVIPEIYYYQAVNGRTPNLGAQFMEGAKSANFIVSFVQNPANWQAGVNYAKFWGGDRVFDQPYKDRDFFGAYVSRNF